MKEYTTLEALKALTENPELVFDDTKCKDRFGISTSSGFITWLDNNKNYEGDIHLCNAFLKRKWILADQPPVSFMEAIKSGKKIKAERGGEYKTVLNVFEILSSYADLQSMLNVVNGNWYIKEEE